MQPPISERERGARELCAALRGEGHQALLAGGCVRDLLLGQTPKDFDIATSAPAPEVQRIFPRHVAVGAAFGVVRVQTAAGDFEVATFRHDGPYLDGRHPAYVDFTDARGDAERRDFTINALFLDPETDEILDFVGGRSDLKAGIIRAVGDPARRFSEDHLRLLRAARFAARLDFAIEPLTRSAMGTLAPLVTQTSAERIRDELTRMLTEGRPARALRLLDETGLLREVLPEVDAMKGVEQPPEFHPEGDVFVHTLLVLEQLRAPQAPLAFGALLHDVGKPPTQTFEDRIRFNEHEKVGASMADAICRRLRFSTEDRETVVWLVAQHMRLAAIPDMRESKRKRFVREPEFPTLLELCRADCLGSHGDVSTIEWIQEYMAGLEPEAIRPTPLVTGHDLIAQGYSPGPLFRTILSAIEDEQLEGRLADRDAALQFVLRQWPPPAE